MPQLHYNPSTLPPQNLNSNREGNPSTMCISRPILPSAYLSPPPPHYQCLSPGPLLLPLLLPHAISHYRHTMNRTRNNALLVSLACIFCPSPAPWNPGRTGMRMVDWSMIVNRAMMVPNSGQLGGGEERISHRNIASKIINNMETIYCCSCDRQAWHIRVHYSS